MKEPSGATAAGRGIGRLLLGTLLFALFAPVGLIVVPLALLLFSGTISGTKGRFLQIGVAAVAVAWLLQVGEIPEQTVRAASVIGAAAFSVLTRATRLSTIHRGLVSSLTAFVGVSAGYVALGFSWAEVSWNVQHRIGFVTRQIVGRMWTQPDAAPTQPESTAIMLREAQSILDHMAGFVADYFAAILVIQLLIGFALATSLYRRVSSRPDGCAMGKLRDFTFSEHLGWAAVLGLAGMLLPRLAFYKLVAGNLVLVAAAIYALRGVAVASFILSVSGSSFFLIVMIGLAIVFMLPLVAAGAIVLGVLDTGLNIRKRWASPSARG